MKEKNEKDVEKAVTFDEILEDSTYKSEYDKKVNALLERKKAEWSSEWNKEQESKQKELERQAGLSAEEKFNERLKSVEEREKNLARKEKVNLAKDKLISLNLPSSFAEMIANENTTDEEMTMRIKELQEKFTTSVQENTKKAMAGGTPKAEQKTNTNAHLNELKHYMGLN